MQNKAIFSGNFSRINSFWYGITLPLQSGQLIVTQPKLLAWSTVPIIVTFLVYYFLFSHLETWTLSWMNPLLSKIGLSEGSWVQGLFHWIARIILLLFSALTFSFVSSIAACPFNDFLAESAERFSAPPLAPVTDSSWFTKAKLIWIDLIKTIVALFANLTLLLLSWIPGVGVVTFLAAVLLLSFQFISYPQTRRGQGILFGIQFIGRHIFVCLGFGITITFLFSIPFIASFALPIAVVGGTLLVGRAYGSGDLR
jgi:uncharacterized protein involved in cysteine biosynthesis